MATMYTGCNRMDTKSFYRGDGDLIIKDNDLVSVGKAELFGRVFQVSLRFWPDGHGRTVMEFVEVDSKLIWFI